MRFYLLIILSFIQISTFSQTIVEIDSVSKILCSNFNEHKSTEGHVLRINELTNNHINPYLNSVGKENANRVGHILYYRLQINCPAITELLDKLVSSGQHQMEGSLNKPESNISSDDLAQFKRSENLYFIEANGDTTFVKIGGGFWKSLSKNNTTSIFTYKWTGFNEFVLTVIENENLGISNLDMPGDKFLYSVISKENKYFVLRKSILSRKRYETIKIYF